MIDRVFIAPFWVWFAFTIWFVGVGFGLGWVTNQLRKPPPPRH